MDRLEEELREIIGIYLCSDKKILEKLDKNLYINVQKLLNKMNEEIRIIIEDYRKNG